MPEAARVQRDPVVAAIARALHEAAMPGDAGHAVPAAMSPFTVAIAFSGGLDSTVLLHATLATLAAPGAPAGRIVALHVAHGLQRAADEWPVRCETLCRSLGVPFDCVELAGAPAAAESVEAWARAARYGALRELSARHGASVLMTAHHQDDQLETLLLRLARGAGLEALRGIAADRQFAGVRLLRPLLELPRATLTGYAARHALTWIDDPSNADRRFARNAIRAEVVPVLDAALPALRGALARNVEHWRAATELLDEVARSDLLPALRGRPPSSTAIDRAPLRALSAARQAWALRAWLAAMGLRAPCTARLQQMLDQLISGASVHARVDHEQRALLRHRDAIVAVALDVLEKPIALPACPLESPTAESGEFRWQGQDEIDLGPRAGSLCFRHSQVDDGHAASVDANWLAAQTLRVRFAPLGALRQRIRADGHARTLKQHYQAHGVPDWLRWLMPVVTAADRVLFSAAFGNDCSGDPPGVASDAGDRVRLSWSAPAPLRDALAACGHPWVVPPV